MIDKIFKNNQVCFTGNFLNLISDSGIKEKNQSQTADVFSEKWISYSRNVKKEEQERLWKFQKEWYLKLYGFKDELDLANFLQTKEIIFDAGCGLGYLSEWFAKMSPKTAVVAMDISQSVEEAAEKYKDISNIYFIKGDIAKTPFKSNVFDYVSCHAVIMHTENPENTFCELARILKDSDENSGGGGGRRSVITYLPLTLL